METTTRCLLQLRRALVYSCLRLQVFHTIAYCTTDCAGSYAVCRRPLAQRAAAGSCFSRSRGNAEFSVHQARPSSVLRPAIDGSDQTGSCHVRNPTAFAPSPRGSFSGSRKTSLVAVGVEVFSSFGDRPAFFGDSRLAHLLSDRALSTAASATAAAMPLDATNGSVSHQF